jgi:hypothetical protein
MAITGAILLADVKAETLHDTDDQTTSAQIYSRLAREYQRLRRWLIHHAPAYCKEIDSVTIAAGASVINKSSLVPAAATQVFETLYRIDRLLDDGTTYKPLGVRSPLDTGRASWLSSGGYGLSFEEFPAYFQILPETQAPGTYRVIYLTGVGDTMDAATAIYLPAGLEDVVTHRVAAWVRQRHDQEEKVPYHLRLADDILKEQQRFLSHNYGVHKMDGISREVTY